ncbi:MAG TPA: AlpA family phage regulatory protein [Xanthobacteraceae bacterium]|nr:AlpA family phage regulatory protein [Xanthobacteraceae bacterium]
MKLLTFQDLKKLKGISASKVTIHRLAARGQFPKPIKLCNGPTSPNYWSADEIDAWLAAKLEQRAA